MSPPRVLLFTGTGGVGKTTIAAATALRCADLAAAGGDGARTLLLSTDGTRAIDDAVDVAVEPAPTPITEGLWAARVGSGGRGMPDLATLVHAGGWRTVVVDGRADELLTDPTPSVRLVVTAESRVLAEARRVAIGLALDGRMLDAIVANRLLPEPLAGGLLEARRAAEQRHLADVVAGFSPAPVLRVELAAGDLVGLDALRPLGIECYGPTDPTSIGSGEAALRITRGDGGYDLALTLPFVGRDEVDLARQAHELVISVGARTRRLDLPDSLRRRAVTSARFHEGRLLVHFADPG